MKEEKKGVYLMRTGKTVAVLRGSIIEWGEEEDQGEAG